MPKLEVGSYGVMVRVKQRQDSDVLDVTKPAIVTGGVREIRKKRMYFILLAIPNGILSAPHLSLLL